MNENNFVKNCKNHRITSNSFAYLKQINFD